ncbi:MAG TPA: hypothetical protein VGP64_10555, partial [Polyangia bacterium]
LGIGGSIRRATFSARAIHHFLDGEQAFAERARSLRRDGREASIVALETFARELAAGRRTAALGAWRPA